jgi:hypothetical protein
MLLFELFSENFAEYLFSSNITFCCNLLKVTPVFDFFSDCTSPCASFLLACLNSIIQSRKSFRTSPCFSLKKTVTNIKIIRNGLQDYTPIMKVLETRKCTTCRPKSNFTFNREFKLHLVHSKESSS